jgi:hypothetical protein
MRATSQTMKTVRARCCCALACAVFVSNNALGQPSDGTSNSWSGAQSVRPVEIILIGDVPQFDDLEPIIPEWFRQEGLRVRTRRQMGLLPEDVLTSKSEEFAIRVWVAVTNHLQARVYLSDSRGTRFLVRDVPLRNGLDEYGREQLAQVLVTSAEAFAAHGASSSVLEVTSTFENAPSKSPPNAATPRGLPPATFDSGPPHPTQLPEHSSFRLRPPASDVHVYPRVGALLGVALESASVAKYGPGLLMGVGRKSGNSMVELTGKGQYLHMGDAVRDNVIIAANAVDLQLTLAAAFANHGRYEFTAELGGGVDYVMFTPRTEASAGLIARGPQSDWRPLVTGALACSATDGNWRYTLALGLTTSLVKLHYDVILNGQLSSIYAPWPIQPRAAMEVSWQ